MIPRKRKKETHPVARQHRDLLLDFTKDCHTLFHENGKLAR